MLKAIMKPQRMKTFVFVVIETTSLIEDDGSLPDVIELAFLAITRDEIKRKSQMNGLKPRVTNSLVLCMSPEKKIKDSTRALHKIDKQDVAAFRSMDKGTCSIIRKFLKRLPKPVCLVAHNGREFQFPILKHEFEKIQGKLPGVKLVDPLEFFRDIPEDPSCSLDALAKKYLGTQQTWNAKKDAKLLSRLVFHREFKDKFFKWADRN
ncbi:three-prime repair exonuclease 1-like isoform X2 [Ptychodera flava]|uniref:three-prime repair exonuclease 1-like isoform X2 n=1 Tax=Ptychodera flava TaxID=63121 RepID=UPI00396A6127